MTQRLAAGAWPAAWPVALAGAFASAWPVSLYAGMPWLLPALVVALVGAVLIWRRPAFGVAATLALLPFIQAGGGGLDAGTGKPLKPLIGALIVGTAALAAARGGRPVAPRQLWLALAAAVFAMATLASALVSSDPGAARSAAVYLVLGLLLCFAAARLARERADVNVILLGAVTGLLVASLEGVAQRLTGSGGTYGFYSGTEFVTRAEASFGHPSLFAAYLMLSIPVAAAVVTARAAPRGLRVLAAVAVTVAVPALFFTYTRGAILGLTAGSLLWLGVVRPKLAATGLVVALMAAAAVVPSALGDRFSTYRNTQSDAALLLRSGAWDGALGIFSERPLLGTGLGTFPRAYSGIPFDVLTPARRPLFYRQLRDDAQPWHAHNVYLTVLAEGGVVAFTAFALFALAIVLMLLRGARVADPLGRVLCVGVGCSVLAWAAHGVVDFDSFWVSLPLFAFIGVAAAQADGPLAGRRARPGSAGPARRGAAGSAAQPG